MLDQANLYPGWRAAIPTLGAASVIAAGPRAIANRLVLSTWLFVFTGLISYPLYLWHWPLLVYARKAGASPTSLLLVIAVSILLATATWKIVETPIRKLSLAGSRAIKAVGIAVLALSIGSVAGFTTIASGGFPARFGVLSGLTAFNYDYKAHYRYGTCFPNSNSQTISAYMPDCVTAGSPMVLLWGDSYAAHLFPGLNERRKREHFGLTQYTMSGCRPTLYKAPNEKPPALHCVENNNFIMEKVRQNPPDIVILSSYWKASTVAVDALPGLIKELEQIGVKRVVVVGMPPQWPDALPKALAAFYSKNGTLPERMASPLFDEAQMLNNHIQQTISGTNAAFVSPLSVLCADKKCMTGIVGSDMSHIESWDSGHMTDRASGFVADRIDLHP